MEETKNKNQVSDLQEIEQTQSIEEASSFMEWVKQQRERKKLEPKHQPLPKTTTQQIESVPPIAPFSELEIIATDSKGRKHLIGAMDKGIIKEKSKEITQKKKNYSLKLLGSVNNSKIYYNIPNDEFWIEVYTYGKTSRRTASIKLENHDIQTLRAFTIAHARDFMLPLPKQLWIGKKLREKIQTIRGRFNKEVVPIPLNSSRKQRSFGKL